MRFFDIHRDVNVATAPNATQLLRMCTQGQRLVVVLMRGRLEWVGVMVVERTVGCGGGRGKRGGGLCGHDCCVCGRGGRRRKGGREGEGERGQPTAQNMRTLTSNSFFFLWPVSSLSQKWKKFGHVAAGSDTVATVFCA